MTLLHIVRIVRITLPGTSANGSAELLSRDTDGNHVTRLLHCHWLKFPVT